VIKSFGDRDTERLFRRQPARRLGADVQRTALRKLRMLDAATSLEDLRIPPSYRLEKLKGDRAGQYSIRINRQWRVCFVWRSGDARDVEIVDYR
jgi:toxin HigB-1